MPPESEPTIAPQRPMAFDQLTPVARLWVGYSVAVRAFSPTREPLIPMPVPKSPAPSAKGRFRSGLS